MRNKPYLCIILVIMSLLVGCGSQETRAGETESLEETSKRFASGELPFCFRYGSRKSEDLLSTLKPKIIKKIRRKDNLLSIVKTWKMKDGLTISLESKCYTDFPAVEWIVYITNKGEKNSNIISEFYPLAYTFNSDALDSLEVHTNKGDNCTAQSYEPYTVRFEKGKEEVFEPTFGGKSSTGERGWPYWNIQNDSKGIILALGWPGHWKNVMEKESNKAFSIKAGQGTFNSYLKPGETVRTPLVCMLFWEDMDKDASQNLWRRFYLAHVIPKYDDKPEMPATEIQISQAESTIGYAKKFIDAGIKPRICWTDAGWYPTKTGDWLETGDWVMKPDVFPNGIKKFTSWAHGENMESLLWFEPERVFNGDNYLYNHHKEWLVQSCDKCCSTPNLGNKECLSWFVEHIDSLIATNGLDWYREDMNGSGPQCLWETLDSENRKGIHENLYVQGHLALWDELKRRHPNLHIDACASGGRRNDLETMHRAVPLLRSDYQWARLGKEYIQGNQAHTWALSSWFPYQGSAVYEYEPYKYRSFYLPSFGMGTLADDNLIEYQKAYDECKKIQPIMLYGDYWPLTPYSIDKDMWIGWQFNREQKGDGCVQVFRRENCVKTSITVKLRGLDAEADYVITDFDSPEKKIVSGKALIGTGLDISISQKPGAAVLIYKRI